MTKSPMRCGWCEGDPLYERYHDEEWGRPVDDDHTMFEFLTLESAQAGLSWITILRRRENYRKAFAGFDPAKVAAFTETDVERLMQDAGIIRNRAKIRAAVSNARLFLELQQEFGSFCAYLKRFLPDGKPVVNVPGCPANPEWLTSVLVDVVLMKLKPADLDLNSEGLLLLTNDGEFANRLMHPSHEIEKEYIVQTDRPVDKRDLAEMHRGIYLEDSRSPYKIKSYSQVFNRVIRVVLTEGKNREIRKLFDYFGYEVKQLQRIRIGQIELGELKLGQYRRLEQWEVQSLYKEVSDESRD